MEETEGDYVLLNIIMILLSLLIVASMYIVYEIIFSTDISVMDTDSPSFDRFSWNEYTEEQIAFAMRYHGIQSATFCSKEIEPYFYRDGEKILLFTDDVKSRVK